MTLPSDVRKALERLLTAQAVGELTPSEFEQFAELLRQSPEARSFYVAHRMLEAQLEQEHLSPLTVPVDRPSAKTAASDGAATEGNIGSASTRPTSQSSRLSNTRVWLRDLQRDFAQQPLALVVLLMVMAFGGILAWKFSTMPQQSKVAQGELGKSVPGGGGAEKLIGKTLAAETQQRRDDAKAEGLVGRLKATRGATWGEAAWKPNSSIHAGQRLALERGLAEIAFESGATVVLEGPAELVVGKGTVAKGEGAGRDSEIRNSCVLKFGKLVARVPMQAHGFSVHTPTLKIVDLGTEFGVEVKSQQAPGPAASLDHTGSTTEVQVFQGEVSIAPSFALAQAPAKIPDPPLTILKAGDGAISQPDNAPPRLFKAEISKFVRVLPVEDAVADSKQRDSERSRLLQPGDIVAVSRRTLKLIKINPRTGEQTLLAQGDPELHGTDWMCAAVDGEGYVLVGTDLPRKGPSGLVLRINPADGAIQILAQGGLLNRDRVSGLAIGAEGSIFATLDGGEDKVLKIDARSGHVSKIASFGNNIWGIAVDPLQGDVLAASDGGPGQIARFRGQSVALAAEGDNITGARGIAVRPDGRIFISVTQASVGKIVEIDRATHRITEVVNASAQPGMVLGMLAVEPDGCLIVANGLPRSVLYRIDVNRRTITPLAVGEHLEVVFGVAVAPPMPMRGHGTPPRN